MATSTSLSPVFPLGSRLNERGRLEVGGCDTIELAREFGTPAYVVAEDDLAHAARAFVAGRPRRRPRGLPRCVRLQGVPVHRRAGAVRARGAVVRRGLRRRAAPRAGAGFAPERIVFHGNAKSEAELRMALAHRVGPDRDRQLRRDRPPGLARGRGELGDRDGGQPVLMRVTPDVRGETHEKISTGQADSKFGVRDGDAGEAIARLQAVEGLSLQGLHAHIGSQLLGLEPFRREAGELGEAGRVPGVRPRRRARGRVHRGSAPPPSIEEYVGAVVEARARPRHGPGQAPADRARPRAVRERGRDAVHGRERQANVSPGSPSTAACPTTCARCSTARRTRRTWRTASAASTRVRARGQALRVGRRDPARRAAAMTRGRAT